MATVGVVLGAGGIVGAAYHSGVLTALAEQGFDARDADLIVGTSAGSGIGATLRAGFPPLDLAPRTLGRAISAEAAALVGHTGAPPAIDLRNRGISWPPLPSAPGMAFRSGFHPAKALAGLMPSGTISADVIGERIAALYAGRSWPSQPLWVCAVDLDRGDRVVFGRDGLDVPVGVAVQASSSIPGVFAPVVHGGRRYVDGGVHSPTNADLLAGAGLDLVVIVSPMSATSALRRAAPAGGRRIHARRLAGEVRRIRSSGTEVLTFQPTPEDVAVMGRNPMDARCREATTLAALTSTHVRLADQSVTERLDALRQASA